jgi:DNA-binding GntR family transcriptional regulator
MSEAESETVLADGASHDPPPTGLPTGHPAALVHLLKLSERREPLVVQIATWVGIGIIEGRLKPGEDLNSVELSHRFKTSRTPVREALMLLEQEGLVEMRPRRRPRVAGFTPAKVREIYEVRQHLLALLGRLVTYRATDAELDDLRARLAVMREHASRGDIDGYFWRHVALQERMAEISGNETLKSIVDSLALRTLVLRHAALAQEGRLASSLEDQTQIFLAIESRDADMAAMLLSRATRAALAAIERGGWTASSATGTSPAAPSEGDPIFV